MRSMLALIALGGACGMAVFAGCTPETENEYWLAEGSVPGVWSPDGSKLLYSSSETGNYDVYCMNVDGSGVTNLTNNPADDFGARYSPKGDDIVFISDRNGNEDVWIMEDSGYNPWAVVAESFPETYPSWSPDGTKILYTTTRYGNEDVIVQNLDGSAYICLTTSGASNDYDAFCDPTGRRVYFTSTRTGFEEIYQTTYLAEFTNALAVADTEGANSRLRMSPDGQRVCFTGIGQSWDLFTAPFYGETPASVLAPSSMEDFDGYWSPDGSKIAFCSRRGESLDIYVMTSYGSGVTRLTNSRASEVFYPLPAWPDV